MYHLFWFVFQNLRKSQPASSLQHTNGAKDNTSLSNILGKSDLPSFAPSLSSILDPEDVINASANEIQERWTQKVCSHDVSKRAVTLLLI